MAFRVGQKVVYVGQPDSNAGGRKYVKKGKVYTVGGFCTAEHEEDDVVGLFICEARASITRKYCECFHPLSFRPVVEKSTDTGMAILRKLLTDMKIKEKA